MSNFDGNDEEVPRTAPTRKEYKLKSPTAPSVPEVSMVLMGEKPSNLFSEWPGAIANSTWRPRHPVPSTNMILKEYPPQNPNEKDRPPLQVKTYKKSPKRPQFRTEKHLISAPQPMLKILKDPPKEVPKLCPSVTNINPSQFLSTPPPTPAQASLVAEHLKISDNIAGQLKSHEIQIAELKSLVEKLTADLIEYKIFISAENEKSREILMKQKIYYESVGIQCKLDEDKIVEDENQENKTNKRPAVLKSDQKSELTGAIPKNKPKRELIDAKRTEIIHDNYEILSALPRSRTPNEAMEIMELTCKYIPSEKLKEWGAKLKEPGKADVSIATRRYMEKYGLIGSTIPEEKDEEGTRDPEITESDSGEDSTNRILDTKAIKNQPKFM